MTVHTGEAVQRDEGNYVGTTIIRTARIRLTNPQIAERLFMGKATVKTHVTHALAKVGKATGSELAAAVWRRT